MTRLRGEPCEVKGCGRGVYCRGYCRPHYRRFMRGLDPAAPRWSSTAAPAGKVRLVDVCSAVTDASSDEEFQRALWRFERLVAEAAAARVRKYRCAHCGKVGGKVRRKRVEKPRQDRRQMTLEDFLT